MSKANGSTSDPDILESHQASPISLNEQTQTLPEFAPEQTDGQQRERRSQDPLLGQILANHYKIEERIGEGGMCAVYRAIDLTLNRSVAVKVLLPGRLVEEGLLRFQREAKTVGALDHPNIMRIYELNSSEEGDPFMVMELLQGQNLAEMLKGLERPDWQRCVNIARQCAAALACAHAGGFVHRDVKPSNIIVSKSQTGEDVVKLVDFGIAHVSDPSTMQLTRTGDVFGSPYYMSPEQCRGDKIDKRSDLYSLGCVLYECAAGRAPFQGSSALDTLRMHADDIPVPPSKCAENLRLAAQVDHIVLKCLAKNPDERYQTAEELDKDLADLMSRGKSSFAAVYSALLRRLPVPRIKRDAGRKLLIAYAMVLVALAVWAAIMHGRSFVERLWDHEDVLGQREMSLGDYKSARQRLLRALAIATYFPIKKSHMKIICTAKDLSDLAVITGDLDLRKKVQDIHSKYSSVDQHSRTLLELRQESSKLFNDLKELNSRRKSKEQAETAAQEMIERSCDLAMAFQAVQHRNEGYKLLRAVSDEVASFIAQENESYQRLCFNLAMFSSTEDVDNFQAQIDRAADVLDQSVTIGEIERAGLFSQFARAYMNVGSYQNALVCIDKAIKDLRLVSSTSSELAARVYLRKAEIDQLLGHTGSSTYFLAKAQSILKSLPPSILRDEYVALGEIARNCKQSPSNESLQNCIVNLDRLSTMHLRSEAYTSALLQTGILAGKLGQLGLARSLLIRSATVAREHSGVEAAKAYDCLGEILASYGKTAMAVPYLVRAVKLTTGKRTLAGMYIASSINLAAVYSRQGKSNEAYRVLKDIEPALSHATASSERRIMVYQKLYETAERLGLHEEAALYRQKLGELKKH